MILKFLGWLLILVFILGSKSLVGFLLNAIRLSKGNIDGVLDDIVPRKIYLHKISVCIESTFRWSRMIGRKLLTGDEKYSEIFL
jgi:hypothetical protein